MVYFGIPTYDSKLHWTTVAGLMETARACGEKKIGVAIDVIPGDAFIGKARNLIAHRFMKSNFRDLVFVDADVGFDLAGIEALCKAEPPIVMGLYRMKCPLPERYPALLYDPIVRHPSDRRLVKLQYGPAGFLRIRREVFEAMKAKWPDQYYVSEGEEMIYDFFPSGREVNHFTGEDLNFCIRSQVCGFDVWAMQDVKLTHSGESKWESRWAIDVLKIAEAA
jgi:hypothetical protein